MNDRDENNILLNSRFIMDGIRQLNEPTTFKEIKVYNDIDTSLKIEKKAGSGSQTLPQIILSLEEVLHSFTSYLTISEPNTLEFKS